MTALIFAVASALLLGVSDFCAARSARTAPSVTVTRTAVITSTLAAPFFLLVRDFGFGGRDSLLALGSGIFMTSGLLLLYRGYAVARMGVVAPLSSVLLATVPVVWDVVGGARPSSVAALGMALGAVALVLTSYTPDGRGSVLLGAVLGSASGVVFGVAYTFMSEVSPEAGLAPVMLQRLAGLSLLIVVAAFRDEPFVAPPGRARWYAIGTGAAGVLAIGALQVAFQEGQSGGGSMTGPVSVASSQFATVAVVLSVLFNRERMRWWQALGVASTAVAVALIAAG
jgi:drug/metabolite transporter (DMT)-like permease